jgi:DNA-directed RNA polymerase specialized sigma24 family protein
MKMATSPAPYYADLSWLLYESEDDQRALQQTIQAAVNESWSTACEISTKLLQQKQPPGDLWENAIRRTAIDLRERLPGSVDAGKFLLRYFELSARKIKAEQVRMVSIVTIPELRAPGNLEDAVAAKLDLEIVMRSLDADERSLIMLRFANQGSWRGMASKSGRTEDAVRKQCARTIEKLRAIRVGRSKTPR